jgi:hypothetical protein
MDKREPHKIYDVQSMTSVFKLRICHPEDMDLKEVATRVSDAIKINDEEILMTWMYHTDEGIEKQLYSYMDDPECFHIDD